MAQSCPATRIGIAGTKRGPSPSIFPWMRFASRIAAATTAPAPVATQTARPIRIAPSESSTEAVQSSVIYDIVESTIDPIKRERAPR